MHTYRTRFGKDIVAEFLPPLRKTKKTKVVILLGGMPAHPSRRDVLEFFARKGYWVFQPRYRGSWESGGVFLKYSPAEDVGLVLDHLQTGFRDAWSGEAYALKPDQIFVIGVSFGGAAALLASKDARVDKVIALAPVIDWTAPSKKEPLDWFYDFVKEGFGEAYRMSKKEWNKLKGGTFYSPWHERENIPGKKVLMFHAKDDDVVAYAPSKRFARKTGATLLTLKRGGHLSSSLIMKPHVWKRIHTFLKMRS